jgi:hypothetical protein
MQYLPEKRGEIIKMKTVFRKVLKISDFGNGRYVRSLIYKRFYDVYFK